MLYEVYISHEVALDLHKSTLWFAWNTVVIMAAWAGATSYFLDELQKQVEDFYSFTFCLS